MFLALALPPFTHSLSLSLSLSHGCQGARMHLVWGTARTPWFGTPWFCQPSTHLDPTAGSSTGFAEQAQVVHVLQGPHWVRRRAGHVLHAAQEQVGGRCQARGTRSIHLTHAAHGERDSHQGSKCTVPGRTRTACVGGGGGKMLGARLTGARQQVGHARAQPGRSRTGYNLWA